MFISLSTATTILTLLAASAPVAEAAAISERTLSLANQQYYGAKGQPWQKDSVPAAYCGKNKPTTSDQWKNLPYWDGGDSIKCSSLLAKLGLKVCNGGNPSVSLPNVIDPPHNFPSWWYDPKPQTPTTSVPEVCTPAKCTSATWWKWECITKPALWKPTCVPGTPKPTGAAPTTTTDAAPPAQTTKPVDPIEYPVCQSSYQVTYEDYQLVAPNGVYTGQTVGSATRDDSYITYTLANNVGECLAACDQIEGCAFVNSYYDTTEDKDQQTLPKYTPGTLTCAFFGKCVGTDKNDNFGGQHEPNKITNSNGYCKSGACSA